MHRSFREQHDVLGDLDGALVGAGRGLSEGLADLLSSLSGDESGLPAQFRDGCDRTGQEWEYPEGHRSGHMDVDSLHAADSRHVRQPQHAAASLGQENHVHSLRGSMSAARRCGCRATCGGWLRSPSPQPRQPSRTRPGPAQTPLPAPTRTTQ